MDAGQTLVCDDWRDYALLDSGDGRKLERFGAVTVSRPDPQAIWRPASSPASWRADAVFDSSPEEDERGRWTFPGKQPPEQWEIAWDKLKLRSRCASFRHMGVFPEHSVHWRWAADRIRQAGRPVRLLNLFGYTGMMSLAAAAAGAEVLHLDASPKSIAQGRENQTLSGLDDRPIRWICDDAIKFVERERRRGRQYDAIVLDPPKYGRGPKNEIWRLEEDFPVLLDHLRGLLSAQPLFVIATVYAVRLSPVAVLQTVSQSLGDTLGSLTHGEMAIREMSDRDILLPTGLFVRAEPV